MPNVEYIRISMGAESYVYPEKPEVPNYYGAATHMAQQKEDYKEALSTFFKARNIQTHLRRLMLQAILVSLRSP
jgi:hypothetical protein